jgi:hypothetical protein
MRSTLPFLYGILAFGDDNHQIIANIFNRIKAFFQCQCLYILIKIDTSNSALVCKPFIFLIAMKISIRSIHSHILIMLTNTFGSWFSFYFDCYLKIFTFIVLLYHLFLDTTLYIQRADAWCFNLFENIFGNFFVDTRGLAF